MKKMTAAGAKQVVARLDEMADLFQKHFAAMGIPEKIATDMAYRCDMISDHLERRAGLKKADGEEVAEDIGADKPVEEHGQDKPYMAVFEEQDFNELQERVEDGDLENFGKTASKLNIFA